MFALNLFTMFVALVAIFMFIIGHAWKWIVFALWIVLQGCGRAYGGYIEYRLKDDKSLFFPRVVLPILVMDVVLVILFVAGLI